MTTNAKLRRVLGPPPKQGDEEPFEPIGDDVYEICGLTSFGSPKLASRRGGFTTLRYRRRVFATTASRLTAWATPGQANRHLKVLASATS